MHRAAVSTEFQTDDAAQDARWPAPSQQLREPPSQAAKAQPRGWGRFSWERQPQSARGDPKATFPTDSWRPPVGGVVSAQLGDPVQPLPLAALPTHASPGPQGPPSEGSPLVSVTKFSHSCSRAEAGSQTRGAAQAAGRRRTVRLGAPQLSGQAALCPVAQAPECDRKSRACVSPQSYVSAWNTEEHGGAGRGPMPGGSQAVRTGPGPEGGFRGREGAPRFLPWASQHSILTSRPCPHPTSPDSPPQPPR